MSQVSSSEEYYSTRGDEYASAKRTHKRERQEQVSTSGFVPKEDANGVRFISFIIL